MKNSNRSKMYREIRDTVLESYGRPGLWTARWRSRVGFARLVASSVAWAATRLLNDISMATHRNDPELKELLREARAAATAYAHAFEADNWDRMQREGRYQR